MAYVKSDEFVTIALDLNCDDAAIFKYLTDKFPAYVTTRYKVRNRIANYRRKGLLPLASGNVVSTGEHLLSTSTLFDDTGNIKLQWVKSSVPHEQFLEAFTSTITELASAIPAIPTVTTPSSLLNDDLATLYVSNDVHLGALMWNEESGADYNLVIGTERIRQAYNYLIDSSPQSKIGIIVDLGDLLEVDNDKNMTPKSGNILATDSRYPKILRAAYESLIYGITKALTKHEIVYFYNIGGNHDGNTTHAVREVIRMSFRDNPRVIVNESPAPVKYHQHDQVLIQFAHGDGMKMRNAGEVMAHDCQTIFSSTTYRYSHFGHTHVDSVYDGKLCKVESHRNLAPNNHWASAMGYRSQPGTMKSITYDAHRGEVSRSLFTL